jgi:pimeloyl-ACP methyl ester carboxylesterase
MSFDVAATAPAQKSTNVRTSPILRGVGLGLRSVDLVAPDLAAKLAANLFLTPRRIARPARELQWIARAERVDYHLRGRRIATWSRGEGETILLVHGWEGRGSQLGAFADEYHRSVAVDLPAHGASDGKRTNIFECAAVVGELIDRIRPRAIIAHSFGCAATTVALRDRKFDGRLVFVSPPEDFNFFTTSFGDMLGIPHHLAHRMQREIETRFETNWDLLRGATIAPTMTAPLLVIHDEEDREVPFRYGQALAAEWPGAHLARTRGLGHRRILRDPGVVAAAQQFIREG